MFKVEVTSNIDQILQYFETLEKKLPSDIDKILDDTASKIKYSIEEDIKIGYAYGTIKKKTGSPYIKSGKLLNSIIKAKASNLEYNIFVGSERSEIAKYIYYDQNRQFFRIHPDIDKYLENQLKSFIK